MNQRLGFILLVSFLVFGCSKPVEQMTAEERLAKIEYIGDKTDFMVPPDYVSLEKNIDILLGMGGRIGPKHYDELEAAVDRLERQGQDVSVLRNKLTQLDVAPNQKPVPYNQSTEILSERNIDNNNDSNKGQRFNESNNAQQNNQSNQAPFKLGLLSPRGCEGEGPRMLGASPIALSDLQKILPMGMMSTQHITPTDHQ
ncbi:MAG TPA: hypothetical protein VFF28_01595 [Candidatus Nanoarchaeia archaeon]|nr:hypothetical protein [Candidatus Nanoarchaeia archaeon]